MALKASQYAKNLGVSFDSQLDFKAYAQMTKSAFYHLKNISKFRPFVSQSNTENGARFYNEQTLLQRFVIWPQKHHKSLQLIQNSAGEC
ncbi:hypothetical protein LDENG_00037370 [Lucifuga dentata]|nr:hypothetical protein LDENG_00037370 [Lucifuga dentata]